MKVILLPKNNVSFAFWTCTCYCIFIIKLFRLDLRNFIQVWWATLNFNNLPTVTPRSKNDSSVYDLFEREMCKTVKSLFYKIRRTEVVHLSPLQRIEALRFSNLAKTPFKNMLSIYMYKTEQYFRLYLIVQYNKVLINFLIILLYMFANISFNPCRKLNNEHTRIKLINFTVCFKSF